MSGITLQNCLDASSYFLGESGTPASATVIRTEFANEAKENIRNIRNWSWELKTGTPINIVSGTTSYSLGTAAPDFKNQTAMQWVSITDVSGNVLYYAPVKEEIFNQIVNESDDEQVYWVEGNVVDGFILKINPSPTANVTNGINYRYYSQEPDFVNTTDLTRIPKREAIGWFIAAKVLYGYREQAQYQLAMNEYQNALGDLAMTDMKLAPHTNQQIQNYRQYQNASTNFKTYY